mmetsp:Transcript_11652/g.29931  ORF Transcript_11652/g.29931 Transcript_11652/m.29931 type:complete len:115 (-) Transcript_11652:130-474(-)
MTRGGHYDATVPLFGEETTAVKTFDIAFGVVTVVFVLVTLILLFSRTNATGNVDIFFGVVLILVTIPEVILVAWFRRGDLHPKFRWLIGYMMVTVILLCMCGIGYVRWHHGICS